jgi:hypothetical protein
MTTGMLIIFGRESPDGDDGAMIDTEGSAGKDLKNFSTFLESSLSLCFIHPTVAFFALTKYHRAPSPLKVSAKGEISSPLFRVATTAEDSSGAVKSRISLPAGNGPWVVAGCEYEQTAISSKIVKITTAGSSVSVAFTECFFETNGKAI